MNRKFEFKKRQYPYEIGFENFDGVSCYRNSTLQALFSIRSLNIFFKDVVNQNEYREKEHEVLASFARMIKENHEHNKTKILYAWDKFSTSIWEFPAFSNNFDRRRHEDALEFMTVLIYHLNETWKKIKQGSIEDSIENMFKINIHTRQTCQAKRHEYSVIDNHFALFHIEIGEDSSLENSLINFFNNKHDDVCLTCRKETKKEYTMINKCRKIIQAPPVLVIQLQRFFQRNEKVFKNTGKIIIPFTLDLNEYFQEIQQEDQKYQLSSIIFHIGHSAQCNYFKYKFT